MKFSVRLNIGLTTIGLALSALGLTMASGQAIPTATRSAGLSVFGGASLIKPDYSKENDLGFVIGGAYTRNFKRITVGLEPRYGSVSGDLVTINYFLANIKLERAFGRRGQFHPFAVGGIGRGSFHLGHPLSTTQISSPMEVVAGGLDYDVNGSWGIKGEYQYQFMDFGINSNGLNPSGPNVAIYYRIGSSPFHRRR